MKIFAIFLVIYDKKLLFEGLIEHEMALTDEPL